MTFKILQGRYDPLGAEAIRTQGDPTCEDYYESIHEYEANSVKDALALAEKWCDEMTNCGIEHMVIGVENASIVD